MFDLQSSYLNKEGGSIYMDLLPCGLSDCLVLFSQVWHIYPFMSVTTSSRFNLKVMVLTTIIYHH